MTGSFYCRNTHTPERISFRGVFFAAAYSIQLPSSPEISGELLFFPIGKERTELMTHEEYMGRALTLALRGTGRVSPNPLVGAVIVKDGRVIGEGWHAHYGGLHAERAALQDCAARGENPAGADIYVTLEPCCHHGKQPPCTDALIQAGIRRVFTGAGDPNPKVAGKGIQMLRDHGIEVTEHVLEKECLRQNEVFFHYITTGLPFVCLKYAMTLDGKTACFTGESRWVTGKAARRHVHETRNRLSAIMAGVGTVIADDPLLTCRLEPETAPGSENPPAGGRNPVRIICDSALRTPLTAKVAATAAETPTILATCCGDEARQAPYKAAGCRILLCRDAAGDTAAVDAAAESHAASPDSCSIRPRVDLMDLMRKLGTEGIDSVLLEGGGTLAWSALESDIVNKVQAYIAPKLFGGAESKTPLGGRGFPSPAKAPVLENVTYLQLGRDLLVEGYLPRWGPAPGRDYTSANGASPEYGSTDADGTAGRGERRTG